MLTYTYIVMGEGGRGRNSILSHVSSCFVVYVLNSWMRLYAWSADPPVLYEIHGCVESFSKNISC